MDLFDGSCTTVRGAYDVVYDKIYGYTPRKSYAPLLLLALKFRTYLPPTRNE